MANQKQTLNNKTPEEITRSQTSRNLNEYVILKEKKIEKILILQHSKTQNQTEKTKKN